MWVPLLLLPFASLTLPFWAQDWKEEMETCASISLLPFFLLLPPTYPMMQLGWLFFTPNSSLITEPKWYEYSTHPAERIL